MSLNGWTLNSQPLNSPDIAMVTGSGNECTFKQTIAKHGVGQCCAFAQKVQLLVTGSGQICAFAQKVGNFAAGKNICSIVQTVIPKATTGTFLSRNGWYPIVYVNKIRIPDQYIIDKITITRQESYASSLTLTLLPPKGTQNLSIVPGQLIQVFAQTRYNTQPTAMFTGYVTLPEVDLVNGKTTYTCSDLREQRINQTLGVIAPTIGYWNASVFSNEKDLAENISNRLSTVPYSVDFNASGAFSFSYMLASATPTWTLGDSDVYRSHDNKGAKDPIIQFATVGRLVNYVTVQATYQYQRCYHREVAFNWIAPWAGNACNFLENGYSVCKRAMVTSAITGAGWPLKGSIGFTPVLASGFYTCGTTSAGWSTVSTTQTLKGVVDPITNANVNNPDGTQQQSVTTTSQTDIGPTLCFGASWTASTRFTQNITEKYTMIVQAPQSQVQYGLLQQSQSVGVSSPFNASTWETYKSYSAPPTAGMQVNNDGTTWYLNPVNNGLDQYFNADTKLGDFYSAQVIGLNQAATSIIRSHRDNHVIFNKFLWPEVDLSHTVKLNCSRLLAQGKVFKIVHTMNITTGEGNTKVDMALSLAPGSTSSTPLYPPARNNYVANSQVVTITGITPLKGPLPAGATVSLIGTHFTGATSVTFAGVPATSFTVISDTQITATYPSGLGNIVNFYPNVVAPAGTYNPVGVVNLGTHTGVTPTPSMNGYIGNQMLTTRVGPFTTNTQRSNVTEQFIVDVPAVEPTVRATQETATTIFYNIAIQNDLLTVVYA